MNYVEVNDNGDAPMQTSGPIMNDDKPGPGLEKKLAQKKLQLSLQTVRFPMVYRGFGLHMKSSAHWK